MSQRQPSSSKVGASVGQHSVLLRADGLWADVVTGRLVFGPPAPEELPWEVIADIRLSNEEMAGAIWRLRHRAETIGISKDLTEFIIMKFRSCAGSRAPRLHRGQR